MPKLALSDTERICIAALLVLGNEELDTAYRLVNPNSKSKDEAVFHRQAIRWWNLPNVKAYAQQLRRATDIDEGEESDAPITRPFLIRQLRAALKATNDPSDRANIAMKLADLSGLKGKQQEKEEREKRVFYLPYVSHCRTCEIMKIFQEISNQPLN